MSFLTNFIFQHQVLVYGLLGFFALLIVFLVIWFIFKPIIKSHLERGHGWYLVGYIVAIVIGYFFSGTFTTGICFNVPLKFLCDISLRFVVIVGICILLFYLTKAGRR